MHETLALSNLLRIENWPLRNFAIQAAGGDLEKLEILYEIITEDGPTWSKAQLLAVAPVLYAALSTAEIPRLRELEALDMESASVPVRRVSHSLKCLEMVFNNGVGPVLPAEAFMDMWDRVWAWVQFFDEYQAHLPFPVLYEAKRMQPVDQVFSVAMNLFNAVWDRGHRNPDEHFLTNLVSDAFAPKILVIVGRAWGRLLRVKDDLGLFHISRIIPMENFCAQKNAKRLNELGFGLGGTWELFAATVVAHLRRASTGRGPKRPVSEDDCQMIYAMLTLSWTLDAQEDFRIALYEAGFASALTQALAAVVRCPPGSLENFAVLPREIFRVIAGTLQFPSHFRSSVEEALREGLLQLLFESAASTGPNRVRNEDIMHVLKDSLPRATIYRPALLRMAPALASVERVDRAAALGSSELLGYWHSFCRMAQDRLELLEDIESRTRVMKRSCDNVQCNKVLEKRLLQRCSGCLATYYCSGVCQRADWKQGEHRRRCSKLKSQREHDAMDGNSRDWAFIRALMNKRYAEQRENIALRYLRMLYNARGARATFTGAWPVPVVKFDLSKEPGEIKLSIEAPMTADMAATFPDEIRRVRRSEGRLRMHVLMMVCPRLANPGDDISCARFVPLRCENARFEQGIREILAGIKPRVGNEVLDVERYRPTVRALMGELGVETH
ncbi:MYND-type domain-containing protein [Mycena chlorophos]|uniref:phytol kinase n=1 Tax=Mycena chlorophos TaxID=658473 RepID=A0A8H6S042_MYCCL|nr:MYND-type domain-containing protein [Mycena chlorophos]